MQIINSILETQKLIKSIQLSNKTIGFVPTMGALHQGHIELVRRSKLENDFTVCSIFVNPTQFNNPEDLVKYPRTLDSDCELLKEVGCDLVFAPSSQEMYQNLPTLKFDFGNLEHVMEGKFRPGHFNGVGIVVAKLFNIIKPTKAYFGLKDLQQVAVINCMVKDLSFDLEIVACETIREKDGLAMSSRNRRLSEKGRSLAPEIYKKLLFAKELLLAGTNPIDTKTKIETLFSEIPDFTLEYIEISDFETLNSISIVDNRKKTAICIAAFLDNVRLIDNIVF